MKTLQRHLLLAALFCFLDIPVSAQKLEVKGEWIFRDDTTPALLVAQGNYAYTLSSNRTLRIIDATDAAKPRVAKEIPVLSDVPHAAV